MRILPVRARRPVVQELAAIPAALLREKVLSLGARRSEIVAALDLLFTGL
jgi:hypothetical protein